MCTKCVPSGTEPFDFFPKTDLTNTTTELTNSVSELETTSVDLEIRIEDLESGETGLWLFEIAFEIKLCFEANVSSIFHHD